MHLLHHSKASREKYLRAEYQHRYGTSVTISVQSDIQRLPDPNSYIRCQTECYIEAEMAKCAAPQFIQKRIFRSTMGSLCFLSENRKRGGRYLLGMLKFFCVCMVSWLDISDLLIINFWMGLGEWAKSKRLLKQAVAFKIGQRKLNGGWCTTVGRSDNRYGTTRATAWNPVTAYKP